MGFQTRLLLLFEDAVKVLAAKLKKQEQYLAQEDAAVFSAQQFAATIADSINATAAAEAKKKADTLTEAFKKRYSSYEQNLKLLELCRDIINEHQQLLEQCAALELSAQSPKAPAQHYYDDTETAKERLKRRHTTPTQIGALVHLEFAQIPNNPFSEQHIEAAQQLIGKKNAPPLTSIEQADSCLHQIRYYMDELRATMRILRTPYQEDETIRTLFVQVAERLDIEVPFSPGVFALETEKKNY